MDIKKLVTEAKRLIPDHYDYAQNWLDDIKDTAGFVEGPEQAIRYFMMGMFLAGAITIVQLEEFEVMVTGMNKVLH
ncbi:hypothetical protein AKN87_01910 [Thiopseudomonas alkaliphila]|uniref:hypothetical protein n=1 Tax=Thiopseudomonas alkaliphila TaxID=1697053 RepID=UPI00069E5755|nr:hypothetical protein [Thiopseudomonas alkaliphila]AKX44000.1 hypothetical protein AKN87_01910 [Thiopseudomonas alkaliphila]